MHNLLEKTVTLLAWAMTAMLVLVVCLFVGYLLVKGLPALGTRLVFGEAAVLPALLGQARVFDGLLPAIVGTVVLVILAVSLATPVGVCSGIFLAEYAGPGTKRIFGLFFDILAGIPSIVIGLFGFSVALFLHKYFSSRLGPCLLISALSLAFLVLPYIIRSTQAALESLPGNTRYTGLALGASKLQNIVYVLIPRALSGIGSGIVLAIGRCAEDTAVIMLTGVVAIAGIPSSLLAQSEALPFYIVYRSPQYSNQAELAKGYGACLILLVICAVMFLTAYLIKKQVTFRTLYRV